MRQRAARAARRLPGGAVAAAAALAAAALAAALLAAAASGPLALGRVRVLYASEGWRRREDAAVEAARAAGLEAWVARLREGGGGGVVTERVGCREYEAGAQSCVFEGVACVDVSGEGRRAGAAGAPAGAVEVLIVDDGRAEGGKVPGDDWCGYRFQSADPRYFGPRHWPIRNDTVAPQWSCLQARYTTWDALAARVAAAAAEGAAVRWLPRLSLVNLDYAENSHNNHLLKDIAHLLDTALWQEALDARPSPARAGGGGAGDPLFEARPSAVLLPQTEAQFRAQTARDLNRLVYALVLREEPARLYPGVAEAALRRRAAGGRRAQPLLDAFPEWRARRLLFAGDLREDPAVGLVCTSRLAVGSKLGNVGHERVCRSLRERGWALFGVAPPPMRRVGQIYFNQPPRRIVVLQRHATRRIANEAALMAALRAAFVERHRVDLELVSTAALRTAEDYVRVFSRAGVLLTPHGSHAMGQIWMPRHAALVEVMGLGYTDYAFSLLADSCKLWYDEVQGAMDPNRTRAEYVRVCGRKLDQKLDPCSLVKHHDVVVPIARTVDVITLALERMGHPMRPPPGGDGEAAAAPAATAAATASPAPSPVRV